MSFFSPAPVPTRYDRLLAVYYPLLLIAITIFAEKILGYYCFTACEDGPIEYFQALLVLVAFVFGVKLIRLPQDHYPTATRAFFAVGVLACLYVFLEEISYGQRIIGWATPESWGLINDQNETNLHNTSSWLDQKPRLLLEIGVYVGGIIIPLLQRFKPSLLPQRFTSIYPDKRLFLVALLALFSRFIREIYAVTGEELVNRPSELQEAYFYSFVMLYFIFAYYRYKAKA